MAILIDSEALTSFEIQLSVVKVLTVSLTEINRAPCSILQYAVNDFRV